jgi:RNA polymerase sigma-70 factor (ECF subfamily)
VENESLGTDAELWKQICLGNSEAFDALFRENAARLQTFLRHATGNPQAAEDLMQETLTGIGRSPTGLHRSRVACALICTASRESAPHSGGRIQRPQVDSAEEPVATATETVSAITDALQRLPHEQRTLLWLREVEGQSYAELAEILDVPVGTVRSRLFAAREALRAIWRSPRQTTKEGV